MLTKPKPNLISSSEGWEIEVLGLTGVRYTDETGTYSVDTELLHGEPIMVVIRDRIFKKDVDGSLLEVKSRKKNVIVSRLRTAISWDGHEISVV